MRLSNQSYNNVFWRNVRAPLAAAVMAVGPTLWASGQTAPTQIHESPPKPNIVFILVDDMGYGDSGALFQNQRGADQPHFQTPSLDRMAAEGTILSQHYSSSPVCAPSRASLLTGMDQGHCLLRDNEFDFPLEDNHTLGTVLKQAGYYTAAIGKWGVGGPDPSWPAGPLARGFDSFYGFYRHKDCHNHYPGNKGGIYDEADEVTTGLDGVYDNDLFTARAKMLIEDRAEHHAGQPFFLYLAYTLPHFGMQRPPGPYPEGFGLHGGMQWPVTATGKPDSYVFPDYRKTDWPANEKTHATMMHRLDDGVGDVLQTIRDLKIDRNTLVVFTSDNGPHNEGNDPEFFGSWGPFDGIKRDLFEGGAREPAFVWQPGTIPAGQTDAVISAQYDWMATLADVAGEPAPARTDGVSLLPSLTGHADRQRQHAYLYAEYLGTMAGPLTKQILARHGYTGARGQEQYVRVGDFAGVRYEIKHPDDPLRLYDVVHDLKEEHDLSSEARYQSLLQEMRDLLVTARTPNAQAPRPYDDVPLPAVAAPSDIGHLQVKIYLGHWPWLPAFAALSPSQTAPMSDLSVATMDASKPFGIEFNGKIHVPATGQYTFTANSDCGIDLWIHDSLVIDDDFKHKSDAGPVIGSVILQAGWHPLRLDYRHDSAAAPANLKVRLKGPDGQDVTIESSSLGA